MINHVISTGMALEGMPRLAPELAALLLLTMPGTPFLYYGEEVGMRNGTAALSGFT